MSTKNIKKLYDEYKRKLEFYDLQIKNARKEYKEVRYTPAAEDARKTINLLEAKRDLLFQVIKDIEDYL
jgi:hypothetical protein